MAAGTSELSLHGYISDEWVFGRNCAQSLWGGLDFASWRRVLWPWEHPEHQCCDKSPSFRAAPG